MTKLIVPLEYMIATEIGRGERSVQKIVSLASGVLELLEWHRLVRISGDQLAPTESFPPWLKAYEQEVQRQYELRTAQQGAAQTDLGWLERKPAVIERIPHEISLSCQVRLGTRYHRECLERATEFLVLGGSGYSILCPIHAEMSGFMAVYPTWRPMTFIQIVAKRLNSGDREFDTWDDSPSWPPHLAIRAAVCFLEMQGLVHIYRTDESKEPHSARYVRLYSWEEALKEPQRYASDQIRPLVALRLWLEVQNGLEPLNLERYKKPETVTPADNDAREPESVIPTQMDLDYDK